jgi:hypothetical protein
MGKIVRRSALWLNLSTSASASFMASSSLEAERNGDKSHEDHQTAKGSSESEHVRQRDKKPHAGPPSLRQRLAQDRANRGGEGKNPF